MYGLPYYIIQSFNWASLVAQTVENLPVMQEQGPMFDPWIRNIPWRRKWQLTPVFLPGEFHGQRTMAGCSSCGLQESETTKGLKHTSLNDHYHNMKEIYIKFVDRNFNTNKVFVLWSRVIEKLALFKIPHIRKNLKFYILKK